MNKITGLIGVQIQGNVIKEYKSSASIKIDEDGVVSAIAMDGLIFTPAPNQPKQKDWEILSFKDKTGDFTCILTSAEIIRQGDFSISDYLASTSTWEVNSVKRLPDNTVFTIDDKFTADAGQDLTIKGFEEEVGIMKVFSKEHGYWHLSDIKKVDKPQTLNYVVFTKDGFGYPTWEVVEWKGFLGDNWDDSVFASGDKSEAEIFAVKNAPILSFTDVVNVMTQSGNDHFPFFPQLYDLAKERVDGK